MEKYTAPELEVICFDAEDIITASGFKFPDMSLEETDEK
jgi:hypothetical protein